MESLLIVWKVCIGLGLVLLGIMWLVLVGHYVAKVVPLPIEGKTKYLEKNNKRMLEHPLIWLKG